MAVEVQTLWSEVILAGLELQKNKRGEERKRRWEGGGGEGEEGKNRQKKEGEGRVTECTKIRMYSLVN